MEKTLEVLNKLESDGILSRYAIGGAMGATFYVEPVLTFDLDIFAILPQKGALLSLSSLYETLKAQGYSEEGECVNIEGVPVQFLPAHNPLLEEALHQARDIHYEKTATRVLRVEHLIAICLQTGRAKDQDRVRLFRKEAAIDKECLSSILQRFGLEEKWRQWTL